MHSPCASLFRKSRLIISARDPAFLWFGVFLSYSIRLQVSHLKLGHGLFPALFCSVHYWLSPYRPELWHVLLNLGAGQFCFESRLQPKGLGERLLIILSSTFSFFSSPSFPFPPLPSSTYFPSSSPSLSTPPFYPSSSSSSSSCHVDSCCNDKHTNKHKHFSAVLARLLWFQCHAWTYYS